MLDLDLRKLLIFGDAQAERRNADGNALGAAGAVYNGTGDGHTMDGVGDRAKGITGHSLGEFAAAVVAG